MATIKFISFGEFYFHKTTFSKKGFHRVNYTEPRELIESSRSSLAQFKPVWNFVFKSSLDSKLLLDANELCSLDFRLYSYFECSIFTVCTVILFFYTFPEQFLTLSHFEYKWLLIIPKYYNYARVSVCVTLVKYL